MELTELEGEKFWPVFEEYQKDVEKLNQRLHNLLQSYAADYRNKSLTDEKAQKLLDEAIALEKDEAKHRRSYAPKVLQVLPAKKAARYLQLENYANNWRRLGFTADDLSGGGSERFIDANVAWGDEKAIRVRIQEHWDAGADHVCIQPIRLDGEQQKLDERVLKLLAPAPPKG